MSSGNFEDVQMSHSLDCADIIGIRPCICSHNIQLMPDHKPSIEHKRRFNPPMQEVVKKEIIKWLDATFIYPIVDSSRVCLIYCVPKNGRNDSSA